MLNGINKYIILESTIIIFSLVILILSSLNRESLRNKNLSYFDNLLKNWNSSPISNIIESDSSNCPMGYSPLINDQWVGEFHHVYAVRMTNYTDFMVKLGKVIVDQKETLAYTVKAINI